jgi:putative N6-adenine-specific DNA methylase
MVTRPPVRRPPGRGDDRRGGFAPPVSRAPEPPPRRAPKVDATVLFEMVATCDAGMEKVLEAELQALGAQVIALPPRAIVFRGDRDLLWRANLWLRTANRVLLTIQRGRAETRAALYDVASSIPWEDILTANESIAVDSRVSENPAFRRAEFVSQVVKDAICDRLRQETGRRPDVNRRFPDVPVSVHVHGPRITILLDSSGERLGRRGYRAVAGTAPLRETIAAGLLLNAGYDGSTPFLDPFCGSGTIAIEAALIARNVAPGLLRLRRQGPKPMTYGGDGAAILEPVGFAFERWLDHDAAAFAKVVAAARMEARDARHPIVGSDSDGSVLRIAGENAQLAYVDEAVTWSRGDALEVGPDAPGTIVVTNPPYGERLGERTSVLALYKRFGDQMKQRYAGSVVWVLVGDPSDAGAFGLKPSRKLAFMNGDIECRALRFELYEGTRRKREGADLLKVEVPADLLAPVVAEEEPS